MSEKFKLSELRARAVESNQMLAQVGVPANGSWLALIELAEAVVAYRAAYAAYATAGSTENRLADQALVEASRRVDVALARFEP